jgi:hypothetical protein
MKLYREKDTQPVRLGCNRRAGPAAGNQPPQPSTSHTSHFQIQTAEQEAGAFFSIFGAKPINILM